MLVVIFSFQRLSLTIDRWIVEHPWATKRYNLRQPISRVIDIDIELSTVYFRRELLCSCDTKMEDDVEWRTIANLS